MTNLMKKIIQLFFLGVIMLSSQFLMAQTCNSSGLTAVYDNTNGTGAPGPAYNALPVDLSCALGDVLDIDLLFTQDYYGSNFCDPQPYYGFYSFNLVVNGATVLQYVCEGDISAFDFAPYAPITSVMIQIQDMDSWSPGDLVNMAYYADITYYLPPTNSQGCYLSCPGDMNVYLDPGDCCHNVEYSARSIGCVESLTFDTIQEYPDYTPTYGWVAPFDPSLFPEFDPGTQPTNWLAAWTLNGPGSTYGPSMLLFNNLPNSWYMEAYDDNQATCAGIGNGAYWNYSGANFLPTAPGTLTFDWEYSTGEDPYWDNFAYINTASFAPKVIYPTNNNFGLPWDATGTFSIALNAGGQFFLHVRTLDFIGCGCQVTVSNVSYGPDAVPLTGIYVRQGPANGDELCEGETATVELVLLERDVVIDSCSFDITVHDFPNPVTAIACNDEVQMSLD